MLVFRCRMTIVRDIFLVPTNLGILAIKKETIFVQAIVAACLFIVAGLKLSQLAFQEKKSIIRVTFRNENRYSFWCTF